MLRKAFFVVAALIGTGLSASANVLLIVADDVGVDVLSVYATAPDLPTTPTLDRLAAEGVVFEQAWANPFCSSTRATLQTGRYAFRSGVADVLSGRSQATLPREEWTLPEVLDRAGAGHAHALIGKWHLDNRRSGGARAPNLAGYGHYSGSLGAFPQPSYAQWVETSDGAKQATQVYATTRLVDEAIAWIAARDGPWFLQLAFQAAHRPWHVPPPELLSEATRARMPRDASGKLLDPGTRCPRAQDRACYLAMIEAMSRETGRLLASLPAPVRARTHVIFVSDNGTPQEVSAAAIPPRQSKGRLYEGGIRVPLIVAGPAVREPGRRSQALVNSVDLFATVIELATGHSAGDLLPAGVVLDGRSLVPVLAGDAQRVRDFAFAERSSSGAHGELPARAIRDPRFKLIRTGDAGPEELYDLTNDPEERVDLVGSSDPMVKQGLRELRAALDALVTPP